MVNTEHSKEFDDLKDRFDVDVELDDPEPELETREESEIDLETREASVVKPFKPGEDTYGTTTHEIVLDDGSQFSLTVEKRLQCPSCLHVLADEDEPSQLIGTCNVCGTETCPQCRSRCDGCGTLLCPDCTTGHGLKNGTYCSTCLNDVEEAVRFERGQKTRKLELQETRQQRQNIRQDWMVVIKLLQALNNDGGSGDEEEDVFGGGDRFTGGDAFSGGVELDGSSQVDDWFTGIEQEIDQRLNNR